MRCWTVFISQYRQLRVTFRIGKAGQGWSRTDKASTIEQIEALCIEPQVSKGPLPLPRAVNHVPRLGRKSDVHIAHSFTHQSAPAAHAAVPARSKPEGFRTSKAPERSAEVL